MFEPIQVLLVILVYMALLFALSRWAQAPQRAERLCNNATIYSLSLAVYCTSWTFYGSVGAASNSGVLFLAIYLGPTLVLLFAQPLLGRLIRLKNLHHITSIADLISSRYNKSTLLAALVTVICLMGIVPYIALQLKSVVSSFALLTYQSGSSALHEQQVGLVTVILMTLFTILFGVRQLDPTERHPGMMFILAIESLVKLIAFLAVGLYVCFALFDGPGDLIARIPADQTNALKALSTPPPLQSWLTFLILSMAAFMFLPRQFHVAVVENGNPDHIRRAQWLVPAYMLLINLFVIPIAAAGILLKLPPEQADSFVLMLPQLQNQGALSLLVFIGGFSAATGMILISAMTLSTMTANHLMLPLFECCSFLRGLRGYMLQLRWLAVALLIAGGYLFDLLIGSSLMLVNIGLISFAAILQFAPVILGGLFWRRGSLAGAMAGLSAGFLIWIYTLLLPTLSQSGWFSADWITNGPLGIELFRPQALLGNNSMSALTHSVFWSMLVNIGAYILVSLYSRPNKEEAAIAAEFVAVADIDPFAVPHLALDNTIALEHKLELIKQCYAQYMPPRTREIALRRVTESIALDDRETINIQELALLQKQAENILAGAIGGAAAHGAITQSGLFNNVEENQLSDAYSKILAEIRLTPGELWNRVDYYQEREQLLADHAAEQSRTIQSLKDQVDQRHKAEQALTDLNERLEQRVDQRTAELKNSNLNLRSTLQQLQQTQKQLVEADKMAALGSLVAGVAHEINTPLGNSLTAVSLLKDETQQLKQQFDDNSLKRSLLEEHIQVATESIDIIYTNIARAAQLVHSFKQVAVDQSSDDRRVFPVLPYIEEVLFSLRPLLKNTRYQVQVSGDKTLSIDSYPGSFSQIITNLVMNSLQHGFHDKADGMITIRAEHDGDDLRLLYEDDGCGMSQKQLRRLFDPFYTTRRGQGGSGLGAHIVFNLVTQHLNGQIECSSEPEKGLRFEMHIPLSPPSVTLPEPGERLPDGHDFTI